MAKVPAEGVRFLPLAEMQPQAVFARRQLPCHRNIRIPGLVQPLFEKPGQTASSLLFDCPFEVIGLDTAKGEAPEPCTDHAAEFFFASYRLQHVQYCCAFRVGVGGTTALYSHHGDTTRTVGPVKITADAVEALEDEILLANVPPGPELLEKCCKPFIQPLVAPVDIRHVVAKPLMRKFMRD